MINPANSEIGSQTTWHPALAATLELAAIVAGDAPAPVRGGLPLRALQRVRQYVEAHLNEKISVQSLANIAGLSMYHFARAFKQSEGVTPHSYVLERRI